MTWVERCVLTTGLLCAVVGSYGLAVGLVRRLRASRHLANAVQTQGVVDSVELSSRGTQVPTVRFLDASGVMRWGTSRGYRPAADAGIPLFRAGARVHLWYDPGQPSWVMVDGTVDPSRRTMIRALALMVAGLGLLIVTIALQAR